MGRRFLELGASLAICGRREEVLKEAAADLEKDAPGRVAWQRCCRAPASSTFLRELTEDDWAEIRKMRGK